MRADGVVSKDDFIKSMQQMTNEVRAEPSLEKSSVMLPGDPQIICSKDRLKNGIPLDDTTLKDLKEMSVKNDVMLEII